MIKTIIGMQHREDLPIECRLKRQGVESEGVEPTVSCRENQAILEVFKAPRL